MLFNAQRYRTGDEKILMLELAEDEEKLTRRVNAPATCPSVVAARGQDRAE
jgi:hypothetical protein